MKPTEDSFIGTREDAEGTTVLVFEDNDGIRWPYYETAPYDFTWFNQSTSTN